MMLLDGTILLLRGEIAAKAILSTKPRLKATL